tara:strand:+ start:1 stop:774 length:774 start_codon:yes stop_codon:yes gene_type:complete
MSTLELENIKHPDNANTNIALASNGSITVDRRSTDGTITEFRKDGTAVGNIATSSGRTSIGSGTNASGVRFDGSGLTPFYNNAQADGTVDLGYSGGRFNNLYLSGGVYLGGLVGANKLDDYEEGSWTPVFHADSGSTGSSSTANFGATYTKVGNMVTAHCHVRWSNQGSYSASGNVTLGGLPFTSYGSGSRYSGSYSMLKNIENPDTLPFAITVIKGTNYIYFSRQISDVAVKAGAQASYWNNNLNENALSITYQVP